MKIRKDHALFYPHSGLWANKHTHGYWQHNFVITDDYFFTFFTNGSFVYGYNYLIRNWHMLRQQDDNWTKIITGLYPFSKRSQGKQFKR